MKRLSFTSQLLLAAMLTLLAGCSSKFEGEIEFQNNSSTELWVDVAGFDRRVGCGAMGAGKSKTTHLDSTSSTKLPAKIVLTWNKINEAKQSTELLIPDEARNARTGVLLFEFDAQGQWSTVYKKKED